MTRERRALTSNALTPGRVALINDERTDGKPFEPLASLEETELDEKGDFDNLSANLL